MQERSDVDDVQGKRHDRGWVSLAALAGGVPVLLVLSLGASDPYWRLLEDEPVPAPVYSDPGADPMERVPRPSPALSAVNRLGATISEPVVLFAPLAGYAAPSPPRSLLVEPAGDTVNDAVPVQALAVRAGVDEATDVAIALAPLPITAPDALRDTDAESLGRLSSMAAPEAATRLPLPPHFAGDATTEAALGLDRAARIEVQRRLSLAGFDPHGADGVFGDRTRAAIRDAQVAWGYPPTGYLEPALNIDLARRTEEAYQAHARQARQSRTAPESAPVARERQVAEADPGTCARDASGRIIERQSLKCDLKGFFGGGLGAGRHSGETEVAGSHHTGFVDR